MRILLDMDGVVSDFTTAVCKLCDEPITDDLVNHILTKWNLPFKFWPKVNAAGADFWANLEKLPWADYLISRAKEHGEVAFCTSPSLSGSSYEGKMAWRDKYYPGMPMIFTHNKELCASYDSLLVDDKLKNCENFRKYGGKAFLWPNQFLLKPIGELEVPDIWLVR